MFSDVAGADSCDDCPTGWKSPHVVEYPSKAGKTCEKCQPGMYQLMPKTAYCLPCTPGSHQNTSGALDCERCPKGWSQFAPAQPICSQCEVGQWTTDDGAATCTYCPSGKGQTYVNGSRSCSDCDAGKYRAFAAGRTDETDSAELPPDNHDCESCPKGYYQDSTAQTSCLPCIPVRLFLTLSFSSYH